MENHADRSILDLTLRARHLRSAYLAALFAAALRRIRGAGDTAAVPAPREPEMALERR